jgi:hypothetical protein
VAWHKVKPAARYCGISERLLRDLLKSGLRHSRLPTGTILINELWLDEYLRKYEVQKDEVGSLVDNLLRELT